MSQFQAERNQWEACESGAGDGAGERAGGGEKGRFYVLVKASLGKEIESSLNKWSSRN